ncbi:MAG TPA: decarboxylating 6-phosphogluconate dehydrogenase [Aestuariivirgaceae bacterium]|nr:decarboxylating 6-phosphogluconate dehydrogenase [Aestuariivirgaceae bacterium]
MQIGIVGLGRMGSNIAKRLMRKGHECVAHDIDQQRSAELASEGAKPAASLSELAKLLTPPRYVWVMLPAGKITENAIDELGSILSAGDTIIDGGNSFYKDDIRHAKKLSQDGIHYLDVGTSGGIWGLERGFCLMVGGERQVFNQAEPLLKSLAPGEGAGTSRAEQGYIYCGPSGSGHFVKMVHNGIEYGLMQAYAEGFDILHKATSEELPPEYRFDLNLADIAEVWRHGSVVNSWLLDLIALALHDDQELQAFSGYVEDSGEGRWSLMAAIEEAVPAAVLSAALYARFRSREAHSYADRLLSAMRNRFGGHLEPKRK